MLKLQMKSHKCSVNWKKLNTKDKWLLLHGGQEKQTKSIMIDIRIVSHSSGEVNAWKEAPGNSKWHGNVIDLGQGGSCRLYAYVKHSSNCERKAQSCLLCVIFKSVIILNMLHASKWFTTNFLLLSNSTEKGEAKCSTKCWFWAKLGRRWCNLSIQANTKGL